MLAVQDGHFIEQVWLVNDMLLGESTLRALIQKDLDKKAQGDKQCISRLNIWDAESVDEVLARYIALPLDIPVRLYTKTFYNVIFTTCNDYLFITDVFAGKAVFYRYYLDLRRVWGFDAMRGTGRNLRLII